MLKISIRTVGAIAAVSCCALPSTASAHSKDPGTKGVDPGTLVVQGGYGWQHVVPAALQVRTYPQGVHIGEMSAGEHFHVSGFSPSGEWSFGYAWGNTNKCGWVDGFQDDGRSNLVKHDAHGAPPKDCGTPRELPVS